MRKIFNTLAVFTGLIGISLGAPGDKPVVYVSVPPYKHLASRLAGDAFEVKSMVSESDDPHTFSPTPKQVLQMSQASIIFTGEMPFEHDVVAALLSGNPKIKACHLSENVELLHGSCQVCVHTKDDKHDHKDHAKHDHKDDAKQDKTKEAKHDPAEHDHDHDHDHDHELDPHLWLSPKVLKLQATTMAKVLKEVAPEAVTQIDTNLKAVLSDLDALDAKLAEKLAFMKGQTFYVYHGAFAYFARDYGLKQEAIESGSRRPEPKQIANLVEKAKKDGVKLIFVQPQFDQSSAKTLAEAIGGQVMELDPLKEDVFANLDRIADTITQGSVKVVN